MGFLDRVPLPIARTPWRRADPPAASVFVTETLYRHPPPRATQQSAADRHTEGRAVAHVRRRVDSTADSSYIADEPTEAPMDRPDTDCCPPALPTPAVPADEAEANEALAKLAKALGHPARVAIVRQLLREQTCVAGEIVSALPLAQSTVSQHLKQLKEAGLIRGDVSGPRICYCVEPGAVALLKSLVGAL
jgi:ArsR family transcriptional regulator